MRDPNFNVDDFVESLDGTCNSIQDALNIYHEGMEEDDITSEEMAAIYDQTSCCDTCGWWSTDEVGETECEDCRRDNDDY